MTKLAPHLFAEPVAGILDRHAGRLIPLTQNHDCLAKDAELLTSHSPQHLFPHAHEPQSALSGLLLYLGCWDESHKVSQDISSPEGNYWHAIAHRMEPDSANAAYWFRRVGDHPIFPALHAEATKLLAQHPGTGWTLKKAWDPFLFVRWCEEARREAGSVKERAALSIQLSEWQLLFSYCAVDPDRN